MARKLRKARKRTPTSLNASEPAGLLQELDELRKEKEGWSATAEREAASLRASLSERAASLATETSKCDKLHTHSQELIRTIETLQVRTLRRPHALHAAG